MRAPLKAVALVAIGVAVGVLFKFTFLPRPSRQFITCDSTRQFLVEFRIRDARERLPRDIEGTSLDQGGILEVDGENIGILWRGGVRRFLCEGNHEMRFLLARDNRDHQGENEEHRVVFAVSRPSLFHVTWRAPAGLPTCVSAVPCRFAIDLELSQEDPAEKAQQPAATREWRIDRYRQERYVLKSEQPYKAENPYPPPLSPHGTIGFRFRAAKFEAAVWVWDESCNQRMGGNAQ